MNFVLGFQRNVGVCSSLAAELWSLRDGLQLAMDISWSNVTIVTDALAALHAIQDQQLAGSHPLSALIFDCRYLMEALPVPTLRHDLREANICADILAKNALSQLFGFI